MPNYFTQYWTNEQWGFEQANWIWTAPESAPTYQRTEGYDLLDHTAGNMFSRAGVATGDTIFIVTVRKGRLYLGGKIIVGRICSQREAQKALPYAPYEADEHILAAGKPDRFRKDYALTASVVESLTFESKDGPKTLKFKSPGLLDQQTLRGVRRLTEESGRRLASLLRE